MLKPHFSIIVPVYKVNYTYFKECIDSILNQTFKDFEVLLVDDGSPDDCGKYCDEYAELDERVRVLHQPNQGVSAARNNGISSSKGEWILFVDADDWLEADTLSRLYSHVENCSYDILIFQGVREYINRSVEMDLGLEENHIYDLSTVKDKEIFYRKVMQIPEVKKDGIYYSWDKVYRHSFLVENGLCYPVGLAKSEDKVFIACCFEKARYIYYIKHALYHYRINEESICHRFSNNMDKQRCMLAERLKSIASQMNQELGTMYNDNKYSKITDDYNRFLFGIISDVLLLQFYHKDNPDKSRRKKEAIAFLNTEPFKSVIKDIPYSTLSFSAKMKKFMLKHKMVSLFCYIKK